MEFPAHVQYAERPILLLCNEGNMMMFVTQVRETQQAVWKISNVIIQLISHTDTPCAYDAVHIALNKST